MSKKNNKILFTFLLLLTLLNGCSKNEEVITQPTFSDPTTQEHIRQSDDFLALYHSGYLLSNLSERDKGLLLGSLSKIKTNIILLDQNPYHYSALVQLNSALKTFESIVINERDQEKISQLIFSARVHVTKYASIQKINLDIVPWELYSYRFSNGVAPFYSFPEESSWTQLFIQQERYAIRTGGDNKENILISPTFDLTNIFNPGLIIRHSYSINENPRTDSFDISKIINTSFRLFVSTQYKESSNGHNKRPDIGNKEKWQRLDLGNLPTGLDFDTKDSGVINLNKFIGQKVTFAFVYLNNASLGNNYLSWAIERFSLIGASNNFSIEKRTQRSERPPLETIWKHDFNEVQLGDLKQKSLEGSPGEFRNADYQGQKYVELNFENGNGLQLMYSSSIDLSNAISPFIQLTQTTKFYDLEFQEKEDLKLVIAEYQESVDVAQLNWQTIAFDKVPSGDNYDVVASEFKKIPENFIGKKVILGWSHRSRGKGISTPRWQIHKTLIIEEENIPSED